MLHNRCFLNRTEYSTACGGHPRAFQNVFYHGVSWLGHKTSPRIQAVKDIRKMSQGIKNMQLHMLYMSLAVLRIKGRQISYAGAGMPPILVYRHSTKSVESFISKGMPLGSVVNFPYQEINFDVQHGDAIVLMSDGLTEAYNRDRDMLGLDKLSNCLLEHGNESAKTLSECFQTLISEWSISTTIHDDITVLAIKFT